VLVRPGRPRAREVAVCANLPGVAEGEQELVARLRAGDEQAFEALVARHYATMLSVARSYVQSRAVAEEVVQEAWLGVLQSLGRFEGRSSLKTWIVAILVHTAQKRAARERRSVPFASLAPESAVDEGRFQSPDEPFPGHWRRYPASWGAAPDRVAEDRETLRVAMRAIAGLPDTQQAVIRMRDIEGWDAEEVCAALDVSAANQRVLLHRARSRVRAALEGHLDA
jgi:RNA polymerase sigma-70 factor (ECF subfamily)